MFSSTRVVAAKKGSKPFEQKNEKKKKQHHMFFVPIKLPHKVHYRLDLNFWLGIQIKVVKFVYFEKAIKFCEISTLLLSTVHSNKSKEEISQNFVAFSKYMNTQS